MDIEEQKQVLASLYALSKIKIIIKGNGNLLANAQVLVAGLQEINGIQIWWSDRNSNINVQPPKYDRFNKLNAIWLKDEKIWHDLCLRIEREYENKKEALGINETVEDIPF